MYTTWFWSLNRLSRDIWRPCVACFLTFLSHFAVPLTTWQNYLFRCLFHFIDLLNSNGRVMDVSVIAVHRTYARRRFYIFILRILTTIGFWEPICPYILAGSLPSIEWGHIPNCCSLNSPVVFVKMPSPLCCHRWHAWYMSWSIFKGADTFIEF